jgi:short-subunit dehydrogenase
VVATNLTGVIHCTRAFLPAMLARGSGHLVFISSVLGELPAPEHAVYGATKFAVSGLAESLDYELRSKGIRVTLVEPGLVKTEFVAVSGTPLRRFDQVPHQTAEQVAATIVRAVERGRRRCVADPLAWIAIDFRRHFPRLARLLFGVAIRRAYRRDRGSASA